LFRRNRLVLDDGQSPPSHAPRCKQTCDDWRLPPTFQPHHALRPHGLVLDVAWRRQATAVHSPTKPEPIGPIPFPHPIGPAFHHLVFPERARNTRPSRSRQVTCGLTSSCFPRYERNLDFTPSRCIRRGGFSGGFGVSAAMRTRSFPGKSCDERGPGWWRRWAWRGEAEGEARTDDCFAAAEVAAGGSLVGNSLMQRR
jgi:hypothetical protein